MFYFALLKRLVLDGWILLDMVITLTAKTVREPRAVLNWAYLGKCTRSFYHSLVGQEFVLINIES